MTDASPHSTVRKSVVGVPTDGKRALVRRYRSALADALEALCAFGHKADAEEIARRWGFVYVEPRPEVRLAAGAIPPAERLDDEHTR